MYEAVNDRIFWAYYIVTLFFIIIGLNYMVVLEGPIFLIIALLWTISSLCLLILIYYASTKWKWSDQNEDNETRIKRQKCTTVSTFLETLGITHFMNLFVNLLFITILILSNLWASELKNNNSDTNNELQSIYGILIILGGLLLANVSFGKHFENDDHLSPFCVSIIYLIIWVGLVLYYGFV